MISEAEKHPIDYETLCKGDILSVEQIEKITGISPKQENKFNLARLQLINQIDCELQRLGIQYTVAQVKGSIKILTDEEASEYNDKGRQSALVKLYKHHTKLSSVDTSEFDDKTKKNHERRIYLSSKFIQACNNVRKEIKAAPYKRNTPLMIGGN